MTREEKKARESAQIQKEMDFWLPYYHQVIRAQSGGELIQDPIKYDKQQKKDVTLMMDMMYIVDIYKKWKKRLDKRIEKKQEKLAELKRESENLRLIAKKEIKISHMERRSEKLGRIADFDEPVLEM